MAEQTQGQPGGTGIAAAGHTGQQDTLGKQHPSPNYHLS